jgi:hypothetical protein
MPWQEIMAGLIVIAAGVYVVSRLRGRKEKPQGPDVPVSKLTRKRSKHESCGH